MPADNLLDTLAWSMARDDSSIPDADLNVKRRPPAGYTYFGQFVDHDLSCDLSPLPAAVEDPTGVPNLRRNLLCLDNLYGMGPGSATDGALYEANGLYFRLGAALSNAHSFDVPLDGSGQPLTADPRNAENALVRQVHALFLQLHNRAIDELGTAGGSAPEKFAAARERVQEQYQYLVSMIS